MLELDGTETKSKLGANAILAVSLANAKAAAEAIGIPLFKYLWRARTRRCCRCRWRTSSTAARIPTRRIDFQERRSCRRGLTRSQEGLRAITEIFQALNSVLTGKGMSTAVGDEGGFAPKLASTEAAIEVILQATKDAGYKEGKQIFLALDVASSGIFLRQGERELRFQEEHGPQADRRGSWWIFTGSWTAKYPIVSIEDGCAENGLEDVEASDGQAGRQDSACWRRSVRDQR